VISQVYAGPQAVRLSSRSATLSPVGALPSQNLYCRLSELLDGDFLYEQTRTLYSHTGQPLLDPVLFFKLMLNTVVCGCASSTFGAGRKAPVEPSFYRRLLRQQYDGVEVLAAAAYCW
jgi:hypothetical protein